MGNEDNHRVGRLRPLKMRRMSDYQVSNRKRETFYTLTHNASCKVKAPMAGHALNPEHSDCFALQRLVFKDLNNIRMSWI